MEDKRFTHIANDPKFRRIPKGEKKVKIDKRFKSMFKDKKFKVKYTIDSRGRPVNHTSTEDLKRYYHLSSEESSSEDEDDESNNDQAAQQEVGTFVKTPKTIESDSNGDRDDLKLNASDAKVPENVKRKLKNLQVDYARGEGILFAESSSDDESEPEEKDTEGIEHKWGELDADAEQTDDATYRLAACNMDWDRIRAVDLMVLFNSFVPQGSVIKSVAIYPSEFGKERMKEEEAKGPIELIEEKLENPDKDVEETEEGSKYHMEKLRKYQLNRLKYYYAVVICDNAKTANKIYAECDGMEYESSATKIDLRFIPDDMTFPEEPKEVCDTIPEVSKYQPRFFANTALQQAKVNLTWDETNPDRIELTQKLASGNIDNIDPNDLQAYLASSSGEEDDQDQDGSESEDEETNPMDKYRALLNEIENKENEKEHRGVEMEISWGIDLQKKTEKMIKEKQSESDDKTPFQKYLDKRKEKRKDKREERKKQVENGDENSGNWDDSDIPSDIDMNDPYFAEEFDKPEFKQNKQPKPAQKDEEVDKQAEAELELLLMNSDKNKKHFDMKKIEERENESKTKRKRKKKQASKEIQDDFQVNVEDERFSALYTSHHYNIDPTDSHYRKMKGMEKLVSEKLKRRTQETKEAIPHKKSRNDPELNVLVKSVKRKAQAFVNKK